MTVKRTLLALVLLSWLLGCREDEPAIDWHSATDSWHSGAEEELIAFLRRNEENTESKIFVMRPDGSNVRPQGGGGVFASENLRWSPGGTSLGYIAYHEGDDGVYIMNASGLIRKKFDDVSKGDFDLRISPENFTWSPDGMYLAFEEDDYYNRNNLLRNGSRIYISPINSSEAILPLPMVDTIDRFDIDPSWSPDGTKIAFSSDRGRNGEFNIFLMNPDGSGLERLSDLPISQYRPEWSPDGKKIAFFGVDYKTGNSGIYVMNTDGTDVFQVTHNLSRNDYPCPTWSPDGTRLAFASDHEGNSEIYVINIDGTGLKRLTNDPRPDYSPSWSRGRRN